MLPIKRCSLGPHGPIQDWDVSAILDMWGMFRGASDFNRDLSKWDVSAVTDMSSMFQGASAFNRKLCGDAWVLSKADTNDMFTDSQGLISSKVCKTAETGWSGLRLRL